MVSFTTGVFPQMFYESTIFRTIFRPLRYITMPKAMLKRNFSSLLRTVRLLYLLDYLRFHYFRIKKHAVNKQFLKEHPAIVMPPDYLIYESFQLDYRKYYTDSIETAHWLADCWKSHAQRYNANILDWGCGPARIIRHLPSILGGTSVYYGTDYNKKTIAWCQKNIAGVNFSCNELAPPLDFNEQFFHLVYGISIFTHLSEPLHRQWIDELNRVLVPGGILLITTQGKAFRSKLSPAETAAFDRGNLVVRGKVKEGHRTFSAFQPEAYMRQLLTGFEIIEFQEGDSIRRPQQDVWLVRKVC